MSNYFEIFKNRYNKNRYKGSYIPQDGKDSKLGLLKIDQFQNSFFKQTKSCVENQDYSVIDHERIQK